MKNKDRIVKDLVFIYYLAYAVLIAELIVAQLLPLPFPVSESVVYVLNVISIIVILVTIPVMLKLFSVKTKKFISVGHYIKWSKIQIFVLALPAFLLGLEYYFFRDKTSLYCFFIAFIALIFTKPSKPKLEAYLDKEHEFEEVESTTTEAAADTAEVKQTEEEQTDSKQS